MDKSKSATTNKTDAAKQSFMNSKGATAQPEQRHIKRVQNVLLIWLDDNIDDKNTDCHNTIAQLRQTVSDVKIFTNADPCIDFLTDICKEKVYMLISGSICQNIIPLIHAVTQLYTIYIFRANETTHEQWAKDWPKIKGIFSEITSICEALKQAAQQYEQNDISISFVATGDDISKKNLDQLDPLFMYTQILKEILLTIKFSDEHIKQYTDYCRDTFAKTDTELSKMNKLQTEYHTRTPIWWYTFESFLYPMLNCALRLMDMDIIIKMGFFISDLYRHIQQLHLEQFISNNSKQVFTVYRGQGMLETDFQKMKNFQGGLMSFNNFLSTSKDRQVSLSFAESNVYDPNLKGILFIITVDPAKSTTPFASIVNVGYYGDQEDEVLFSMHTVFRIGGIIRMNENQRLFQVQLILTSDNDKDLRVLTDHIRKETFPGNKGWHRLGLLLLKLGESTKAEQIYKILLEQTTDVDEKGNIFHQLGQTKYNQGEYNEAITFYDKTLEIWEKTASPTDSHLLGCYNNIGLVYESMGDYSKALSYYEKLLEIKQKSLPSNHPDLICSYNNIGTVYRHISDYSKALSYYEKALEISKQSLPSNHPDLGGCYNNIGAVYRYMGDYSKALSYYEKSLEIKQKSLPSNHPDLGEYYNSIGNLYFNTDEYSKALSYYEKSLEIRKQLLPSNHPELGGCYNNIGNVYFKIDEHSKALSYYEKSLEIKQKSLSSNHPHLGMSYNNIGLVYSNTGDYPKALSYYEKSLEISKQSLPSNHPDLSVSYSNIGLVYSKMGDHPKALSSHEKSLEIRKQSLPSNHPDLGVSYNNIGTVYYTMDDYPKALSYFEKALQIRKQSFPSNHPNLGDSYNNIGVVYEKMSDYPKALLSHEKALEIRKQSLPSNHPDLGDSYNNIGNVYDEMSDYPKALSYYEKSLEIRKQSFPSSHPNLSTSYSNIGAVYFNMGDYSEALSYYKKSLEISKQSFPSNHPDLRASYNNIGLVYGNMGDYPKARSFFERAVEIGQLSLPANHPQLQLCKRNLDLVKKKM